MIGRSLGDKVLIEKLDLINCLEDIAHLINQNYRLTIFGQKKLH